MDELEAVRQLLAERPPPAADVVATARASLDRATVAGALSHPPLHLNGGRHVLDGDPAPPRRWRRWRGWLAPAAAAAAVAIVVAVSLAVSSSVGFRQAGTKPATPAAFAKVPRYFVILTGTAVPDQGVHAEVVATATGAVLGRLTAPQPHSVFTEVAAARDDRTFVLAVQHGEPVSYVNGGHKPLMYQGTGPAKLYRLVLHGPGRPGALEPLPVPRVTGSIDGFALSPDGSTLAMTLQPTTRLVRPGPAPPPRGARLLVATLATGAERGWVLPGVGWIGANKPDAQTVSWAANNRTLLFQIHLGDGGPRAEVRLLDTTAPGGNLTAASTRVPIPSADISGHTGSPPLNLDGRLLITSDGAKIVGTVSTTTTHTPAAAHSPQARFVRATIASLLAAYHKDLRQHPWPAKVTQQAEHRLVQAMAAYRAEFGPFYSTTLAITELSVATGKPVRVLGRLHGQGAGNTWADVVWVSPDTTAMIINGAWPISSQGPPEPGTGVMTAGGFTPFPPRVQALLSKGQGTW